MRNIYNPIHAIHNRCCVDQVCTDPQGAALVLAMGNSTYNVANILSHKECVTNIIFEGLNL